MFLEKYPPAFGPEGSGPNGRRIALWTKKNPPLKLNGRMARFDPSWVKKRAWLPGVDSNHQPPGP